MASILFIDDEKNILDGIKRILRPHRKEWGLHFCTEPDQVFALLKEKTIDILVSDMQMPMMHGVDLLESVRESNPEVIRISLTGQVDEEMAAKNAMVSHQQLFKPCEQDILISTLKTAIQLKEILKNTQLAAAVSKVRVLPSLPKAYQELIMELNSGDTSIDRVSMIMASDMGMSSKVLQLVNSAFFGLPRKISQPDEATKYLGVDVIKGLVLSIGIFSQIKSDSNVQVSVEALHTEGVGISQICRSLINYPCFEKEQIDYAQVAGMLLNIGRLMLQTKMPYESHQIEEFLQTENCSLHQAENKILGCCNNQIAAYLLALWGLPEEIVNAIYQFSSPVIDESCKANSLTVLHIANAIYQQNNHDIDVQDSIDNEYLAQLGMSDVFSQMCQDLLNHDQVASGP